MVVHPDHSVLTGRDWPTDARPQIVGIFCLRGFSRPVASVAPSRSHGNAVAQPTNPKILQNPFVPNFRPVPWKKSRRSNPRCPHAASASTEEILPETGTSTSNILSSVPAYFGHTSC